VGREGETKTKLLQEMKKDGGKGKRDGERMKIGVLERKRKAAEKWKGMEKKEEKTKERMREDMRDMKKKERETDRMREREKDRQRKNLRLKRKIKGK
jgi:hypothetical protein